MYIYIIYHEENKQESIPVGCVLSAFLVRGEGLPNPLDTGPPVMCPVMHAGKLTTPLPIPDAVMHTGKPPPPREQNERHV